MIFAVPSLRSPRRSQSSPSAHALERLPHCAKPIPRPRLPRHGRCTPRCSTAALKCAAEANTRTPGLPGRPARPGTRRSTQAGRRSTHRRKGRAVLLHALAHIEFNAINLALDAAVRFPGMPDPYYRPGSRLRGEEALALRAAERDHLRETLGFQIRRLSGARHALGDGSQDAPRRSGAHRARAAHPRGARAGCLAAHPRQAAGRGRAPRPRPSWTSSCATKSATSADRQPLVPLAVRSARGLEPVATYARLAAEGHGAPRPRGPFNFEARRAAGFLDDGAGGAGDLDA